MDAEKVLKNLRIEGKKNILIVGAPAEYEVILAGFSYDTTPLTAKPGYYDFVQVFAKNQAELEQLLKEVISKGKYDCLLWACYPKGTGKIKSDIKRETVWAAFVLVGLDTVTAIAIDETWSALRGRPVEMVGKK